MGPPRCPIQSQSYRDRWDIQGPDNTAPASLICIRTLWIVFGVAAGLGLLNKPSMTFFLLALLAALLCTLRTPSSLQPICCAWALRFWF